MGAPIRELTMIGLTRQKVGTAGVVVDHSKASGLELRQPHGAQAVGLVWRGESGSP